MKATMTRAEFARHIGRNRSWVTRMAQAGRLSGTVDGRINVAESLRLMEQTAGLRDDVAARHAQARGPAALQAPQAPNTPPPDSGAAAADERPATDPGGIMEGARRAKLLAESRRVQAAADREEMERDKFAGQLIARDDVEQTLKFVGAALRGLMDVFPDQVAPVVAPITDLAAVHAALAEACRNTLAQFGEVIERQRAVLERGGA